MRAYIIAGFPGVGKSYAFANNKNLRISDSDSSAFSWIEKGVRNPDFPVNYIDHILKIADDFDVIFVSSHKAVRDALISRDIWFTIVYPHCSLKQEYLGRYRSRGSDTAFIAMIEANWDKFIDEIEELDSLPVLSGGDTLGMICLGSGEFVNLKYMKELQWN